MISVRGLTKDYGDVRAVDDLTFDVEAGKVTGFLGPNGAGKSTTMRMVMGLDRPTGGSATVNEKRYVEIVAPLCEVGALLDAGAMHPGRTGRSHLRIGARSNGIRAEAGRRRHRAGGPGRRRTATGEGVLPGDAAATGHRGRPAG